MSKKAPKEATITILVNNNPHRAGSKDAARFDQLKPGMTVGEALKLGANWRYLLYAVKRQIITISDLPDEEEDAPKPSPKAAAKRVEKKVAPKLWKGSKDGPNRVQATYDERLQGRLVSQGPEQSEVKFDNGNTVIMSNHNLQFVVSGEKVPGPEPKRKEEKPNVAAKRVRKKRGKGKAKRLG